MKAEEILIKETDSFQQSSRLRDDIIEAMEEYTRIQIEKHMEKLKEISPFELIRIIEQVPITLD